jgi:hypothetical protein
VRLAILVVAAALSLGAIGLASAPAGASGVNRACGTIDGVPIHAHRVTCRSMWWKRTTYRPLEARREGIVLGGAAFAPNGEGWGEEHPSAIYNGGDASGSVTDIRWNSWGGSTAIGWGKNPIFKPHGGYYRHPVWIKLKASAVGRCEGRRAYTRLSFRAPKRPGGRLGPWRLWSGASTLCSWPS